MIVVHEALKRGDIQGLLSDTAEGITNDQRATVFGSTQIRGNYDDFLRWVTEQAAQDPPPPPIATAATIYRGQAK